MQHIVWQNVFIQILYVKSKAQLFCISLAWTPLT